MTYTPKSIALNWAKSMLEFDEREWDALARVSSSPFFSWRWLELIERSGSACTGTGWLPMHLAVRSGGELVAAAPLYIKINSEGEFVFDLMWADLASKVGVSYYPKLVGMSPATPVAGYRFLIKDQSQAHKLTRIMLGEIDRLCVQGRLSGAHFLFADPDWRREVESYGYRCWRHQAYVWENKDYADFNGYLASFTAGRRKSIKQERRRLAESGIRVAVFEGRDIPPKFYSIMYELYKLTNAKFGPWSCKYLTRRFFEKLPECCPDNILFTAAFKPGEDDPVALAMLVRNGKTLYGRYWGSFEQIPFLHFELCYYTPIQWAIDNKIAVYDPGMGGEHKTKRGFVSASSHSLHKFHNPFMNAVLAAHIDELNELEQDYIDELNQCLPLKD